MQRNSNNAKIYRRHQEIKSSSVKTYSLILDNPRLLGLRRRKHQQSESEAFQLTISAIWLKAFSPSPTVTEAIGFHFLVVSSQKRISKRDPSTLTFCRHLCTHEFHPLLFHVSQPRTQVHSKSFADQRDPMRQLGDGQRLKFLVINLRVCPSENSRGNCPFVEREELGVMDRIYSWWFPNERKQLPVIWLSGAFRSFPWDLRLCSWW